METVDSLLEPYPTQLREIIEALRSAAMATMPGEHEFVYHDAINYKLSNSPGTWICYVLEGTGKRMRHVKVRTVEQAREDALADLIQEAWTAESIPRRPDVGRD